MKINENQIVVLGPPGCGKTTRLLTLLEGELERGTDPSRVAYVSFTKKAVTEARDRACQRFGFDPEQLPHFKTVHSSSFNSGGLRRSDVLGPTHFNELSALLGLEFGKSKWDETTGTYAGAAGGDIHLFVDNLARARCVPLEQQWRECGISDLDFKILERTVATVKKYKEQNGVVDFTDMLERYAESGKPLDVDVAFVDEAQDLSRLQWKVLRRMLSQAGKVYIAGDDDQAIYRWSGADVSTFLSLEGPREVLSQSWRCPFLVHAMSSLISSRITKRFDKSWSPRQERGSVKRVTYIDQFDFRNLEGSVMLLARNSYLLTNFYDQLRAKGLTYLTSYGAHSATRTHVRAIQAWEQLRKGHSVDIDSARCVYDHLRVGVGVQRGFKGLTQLGPAARVTLEMLKTLYGYIGPIAPWFDVLDAIPGKDIAYYRNVMRSGGSLVKPPNIYVNTIHGVKGGEADNVILSSDMAAKSYREFTENPDDEHRVAYVAVSRARQNLFILEPTQRNAYNYFEK